MSIRLVERGASEGCRPKLPRWPFSTLGVPVLRAHAWIGGWYVSRARRVKLFVRLLSSLYCVCFYRNVTDLLPQ